MVSSLANSTTHRGLLACGGLELRLIDEPVVGVPLADEGLCLNMRAWVSVISAMALLGCSRRRTRMDMLASGTGTGARTGYDMEERCEFKSPWYNVI